ncbi:MAG: prepilin peptidase [Clostridiales bacterium]|nr:prepilin peptidase [Clostridiales bacterium]
MPIELPWPVNFITGALLFVLGVCLGSFANVLIYRIPRKLNFVNGRSFCPSCGQTLAAWDLIPVLSWLFLRGRCRRCKAGISARYPLVELFAGALALLSYAQFGFSWLCLSAFAMLYLLLVLAAIDLDTMEIPDGLIIALAVPALALIFLTPHADWQARLLTHGLGLIAVALPLFLITLFVPNGFGGGDIKFMAVCGAGLGWPLTLVAFFIALLLGGGYGIFALATKRLNRKSNFAFGPALAAGLALSLLYGQNILDWYLSVFF